METAVNDDSYIKDMALNYFDIVFDPFADIYYIYISFAISVFYIWIHHYNKRLYAKNIKAIKSQLYAKDQEIDCHKQKLHTSKQEEERLHELLKKNKLELTKMISENTNEHNDLLQRNRLLLREQSEIQERYKQSEEKCRLLQDDNVLLQNKSDSKDEEVTMYSLVNLFQNIKYYPSPLKGNKDWRILEQFENMYYNSFALKLSKFSSLTQTERRVCLLVRLRLDNTAIGQILCIESESVAKYKMRAKAKISSDSPRKVSLYDMLSILQDKISIN